MMSSSSNICTQLALRQHAPHTAPALWRSSLSARRQNLHPFHNLHIPAAAAVIPGHVLGALEAVTQQKKAAVSRAIRLVPDFPKAGVIFQDVSTLLLDPAAFQYTIDLLVDRYKDMDVQCIAGFEARGFIFGPPVALALRVPFVMIRKAGKLPGETVSEEYRTEYSTDRVEMHTGAVKPGQRVVLVDDLIATGGTMVAGANLIRKVGGVVVEAACIIELPALKGRRKLADVPLFTLLGAGGSAV